MRIHHAGMNHCALVGICVVVTAGGTVRAEAPGDSAPHGAMLRYPAVSRTQIAFCFANDLWLVPRQGGAASPLASPPGPETFPQFSPDGTTLAFIGNYDGDRDLYTLSVDGGIPQRITHHPANERLNQWTADNRLLFASNGMVGLSRQQQLFTVGQAGGMPTKLPVPYGAVGAISADGKWLAYTPHSRDFATWKRYRGGMATDIWLFNLETSVSRRITDWEGTDTSPMWHGNTVYYLSDADSSHRLNIWSYDTRTAKRAALTKFTEFDVEFPSMGPGPRGGGEIVFQNGAWLFLLDIPDGTWRKVEVTLPGARPTLRPKAVDASDFIQSWGISPTGKRAVIQARGDIWTAPADKGAARNLTATNGIADRDPAWSPDGQWIAYFADGTGEYELYTTQSDGKGETKQLTRDGTMFRSNPTWSPDSKHIAFTDKSGGLYVHTIEGGETKLVDKDPWAWDNAGADPNWASDSRWLAYARSGAETPMSSIWIYAMETGEKKQVTSEMFNCSTPVFDRKGDYLYFASQRTFSPTYADLDTTFIYNNSENLLAVPLRADMKDPWVTKSDEEKWGKDKKKDDDKADKDDKDKKEDENGDKKKDEAPPDDPVSGTWNGKAAIPNVGDIDFTLTLTMKADHSVTGDLSSITYSGTLTGTFDPATKKLVLTISLADGASVTLDCTIDGTTLTGTAAAPDGSVVNLTAERAAAAGEDGKESGEKGKKEEEIKPVKIDFDGFERRAMLLPVGAGNFGRLGVNDKGALIFSKMGEGIKIFDLNEEKKEVKAVVDSGFGFDLSADGKKILVARGGGATIQNAAAGGGSSESVKTAGMTVQIDPRAEWKQIFIDAWRIERDYFYDPNMHGVDWPALRDQYLKLLDDCASREDVSYVIGELISELNIGHTYYSGGDVEDEPSVNVGMLGCDFALENGAYRISKIYEGGPWDSDARGPLSRPGVGVKEGDYLLAVNGKAMDTTVDPWAAFVGLSSSVVTLTVSSEPTKDDKAREVLIQPSSGDGELRYRAWIERNRAYVEKQTEGKVGYIYVPNTGTNGQNDLFRQFYGQMHKSALIIDERWNGGGQIPTRFIELLNRPATNYWARRDGRDWMWPPDSHQGPLCMLINGLAGSGGDMFPWLFKHNKLGKLIGMRTWGGLVGISGNPGLIDGGSVTVPTFGFYENDGTWGIEGHGVDPDIEVIDDPAKMVDGGDPQLDAAIANMLDELAKNPYVPPKKPAYPNRAGMGVKPEDK